MPGDRVEAMLEGLPGSREAPAAPAEFMSRVRRRGRRRRAGQAAFALGLTGVAWVLALMVIKPGSPVTDASAGSLLASAEPTIGLLRDVNARSPAVVLPAAPESAPGEAIKVGQRVDPDWVASWVGS